jgi:tripartite-type tricarboxylate transporter receptor subunit TctC
MNGNFMIGSNRSFVHSGENNVMTRLAGIVVAIAALVGSGAVHAQDNWPSRPIKLIVPFAPGGNTDVVARVTANFLQNALTVC